MKFFSMLLIITILSITTQTFAREGGSGKRDGFVLGLGADVGRHTPYTSDLVRHSGWLPHFRLGWAFGGAVSLVYETNGLVQVKQDEVISDGVTTTTTETNIAAGSFFTLRLYPVRYVYFEGGSGGIMIDQTVTVSSPTSTTDVKIDGIGPAWKAGIGIEGFVSNSCALGIGFTYIGYSMESATRTENVDGVTTQTSLENKPKGRIALGQMVWSWYF